MKIIHLASTNRSGARAPFANVMHQDARINHFIVDALNNTTCAWIIRQICEMKENSRSQRFRYRYTREWSTVWSIKRAKNCTWLCSFVILSRILATKSANTREIRILQRPRFPKSLHRLKISRRRTKSREFYEFGAFKFRSSPLPTVRSRWILRILIASSLKANYCCKARICEITAPKSECTDELHVQFDKVTTGPVINSSCSFHSR